MVCKIYILLSANINYLIIIFGKEANMVGFLLHSHTHNCDCEMIGLQSLRAKNLYVYVQVYILGHIF